MAIITGESNLRRVRVDQLGAGVGGGGYSSLLVSRWLAYLARELNRAAKRSADYSERHFRFFGFLSIVIPAAYVIDFYVGKPSFDTLVIRFAAFVLALPLIFHDSKIFRECPHFHLYFVAWVAYILPFSFGLMLALNAASAPEGKQIEMIWILQYVIALFLFIQLIHNGALATVLWCTSTLMILSALLPLRDINWTEMNRVIVYPVTGYLTALFFGIITNRNVDYVNREKLRAASAIGGNIAHELRTPLASIRSLARATNKYSQMLAETYSKARELDIHVGDLSHDQIRRLRSALSLIEHEVAYSNTIIDMLLLNTSEKASYVSQVECFAISDVVKEAVDRFPFNNSGERALIEIVIAEDFSINCSRLLVIHILFNLLKNGIYYAQKSRKGRLTITAYLGSGKKILEITDTGPGITYSDRKHVFDRFYTTSEPSQGAGIGLSFCKSVMESIGGTITCESRVGAYTTFRLVFP